MDGPRTRLLARDTSLSLPGARLIVVRGPDRGRVLHLEKEEVVIGSSSAADLRLTDPTVSRNHFTLRSLADGFLLTDLDSMNATIVDKRRIRSAYVDVGENIDVGSSRI